MQESVTWKDEIPHRQRKEVDEHPTEEDVLPGRSEGDQDGRDSKNEGQEDEGQSRFDGSGDEFEDDEVVGERNGGG